MKFAILLFLLPTLLFSQKISEDGLAIFKDKEQELAELGSRILLEYEEVNRLAACQEFIPKLVTVLKQENSFFYPFDSLKNISIIYPEDSLFRIFTWQLEVSKEEYKYYGAIQKRSADLSLIPLIDRSEYVINFEHSTNSSNEWFGALYYNIRKFTADRESYYLLFGYDGLSSNHNSKLIDILKIDEKGVSFGHPLILIEGNEEKLNRFMITYSENAIATLNFNDHFQKIIYDNLTTIDIPGAEESKQVVPDGTYRGFELKKDGWHSIEKVFNHIYDKAPRPNPKNETKDLFGNPKKQG